MLLTANSIILTGMCLLYCINSKQSDFCSGSCFLTFLRTGIQSWSKQRQQSVKGHKLQRKTHRKGSCEVRGHWLTDETTSYSRQKTVNFEMMLSTCWFFARFVVSCGTLIHPILLPKIYPPLFDLYALQNDKEDEKYWERVRKLNKQGDVGLMAFLGIDQWVQQLRDSLLQSHGFYVSCTNSSFLFIECVSVT